jgi:hypothetical protein
VIQVTCQTGAGTSPLIHPLSTTGFQPEDAVLSIDIAGDGNAAFAVVDGRRAALGIGNGASSDVLHGLLGSLSVRVLGGRGTSVGLLCVGGGTVATVEATVLAKELVVGCVGLVPGSCGRMLAHLTPTSSQRHYHGRKLWIYGPPVSMCGIILAPDILTACCVAV